MDSLKYLHTFSLQAHCLAIKTIDSVDSLILAIDEITNSKKNTEYLVLGEGSNTVFVEDYPYMIICNKIKGIKLSESESDYQLEVGAGENWHELVSFCMQNDVGGFENLALIPGTVGASPIQNIGAYGVEIERFIEKVEFLDTTTLRLKSFSKQECKFAYRESVFKRQKLNHRIITRVFFRLPKRYTLVTSYGPLSHLSSPSPKRIFEEVVSIRQSKLPDPQKLGNAGSFFKNPVISTSHFIELSKIYPTMPSYEVNAQEVKIPAAWLIDTLGFKGKKVGNIACHINQPLVLVNLGDGKGSELLTLAREIRDAVKNTFNIELENEVRLMGKKGRVIL